MKSWMLPLVLFLFAVPLASQTTRPVNQALPTGWSAPTSGPYTMGYSFSTTASDVRVVELGCCQHDANTKTMWLWDSTSQSSPIATVTTAAAASGAWRWGTLSSPVLLVANRTYVVTVQATTYYFIAKTSVPAAFTPSGVINYVDSPYSTTSGAYPTSSNTNYFGPCDIGYVRGPGLTVSATAGTAQNVYANDTGSGGNGILAGRFTVASNSQTGASLDSVTVRSSGTGNDSNAYSGVQALV
ncbi:MAG: DUF4082 domain-containing protein [Planctomycetes bacterium]|nr:DUF4082 domain-containing protein [Planctomycetota bacterium]